MLSLALLSLVAASPAPVTHAPSSYADENVRQNKGHGPIVARAAAPRVATVCHSDPMKGRACRHNAIKAEERLVRAARQGGAVRP